MSVQKKTALITGGSRGIGLGIAQSLAQEGWNLAINGMRSESSIETTLQSLRSFGTKVIYCRGSIGEAEDRSRMVKKVIDHFGSFHALINNAGVAPKERNDLLEMSESSYDRVMGINLRGTFFLTQQVAKAFIGFKQADANWSGTIVSISSISATIASINRGQYCMSKAGMGMMTKLFATRLGAEGIPVFEVRPGVIMTDMTEAVKEKYDKLFAAGLSIDARWGLPSDVGKAVASLVRQDLTYSTGQIIMVDGGLSIQRL